MRRALAAALVLGLAAAAAADGRRSGFDEMSPELQAMQRDDTANPAMLWVAEGEALWNAPAGAAARACADCHGAPDTMAGVAARYPAWDETAARPVDLAGRIALCTTRHQQAEPPPREGSALLSLTALLALHSRDRPVAPDPDPRLDPWRDRGRTLFETGMGQLDFACADCHDRHAGGRLAGALIPQAHPTGYPQYRLQWQDMGSLERRLRNCMTGVRAEPFAPGSDEHLALEVFLTDRAAGLPHEGPAVRP